MSLCVTDRAYTMSQDEPPADTDLAPKQPESPEANPEVTGSERIPVILSLNMHPAVLNLKSAGKYVTGSLEIPEGYAVTDVYLPSVRLNDVVYAETCFESHKYVVNGNGVHELMLKFLKQDVKAAIVPGADVTVFVTGVFVDGTPFIASDLIKVIEA